LDFVSPNEMKYGLIMSKSPASPTRLFKYRPWLPAMRLKDGVGEEVNRTEALLREARLYCQKPRGFDDPHDCHTGAVPTGSPLDIDRWLIEEMAPVPQIMRRHSLTSLTQLQPVLNSDPEASTWAAETVGRKYRRDLRVLCFSAVEDAELMWTFYADQHRGICLEFESRAPFFADVQRVVYAKQPSIPSLSWKRQRQALAFRKSRAWKFQQEWRIVRSQPDDSVEFPRSLLRRVILGYLFPESTYSHLKKILTEGGYQVQIDQMQRTPDSYAYSPMKREEIGFR